jgi:isopenicillin N synthase-like dioxygenase
VLSTFHKVNIISIYEQAMCPDVSSRVQIFSSYHMIPRRLRTLFKHLIQFKYCFLQQKLAWEDPRSNRGYVEVGRERVTQSADPEEIRVLRETAPDCKETMEIGRDWDTTWKNQWPSETQAPGFKQKMLDFYEVSCLYTGYSYKLTVPERLAMHFTFM